MTEVVNERWLTLREFCTIYGVCKNSAIAYRKRGIIECREFVDQNTQLKHIRIKDPGWTVAGDLDGVKPRSIDDIFLIRPCEAAEILGVSVCRIRQLAEAGRLPFYRLEKRSRRYTLGALRQMLAMRNDGIKKPRSAVRKAVVAYARRRLMQDLARRDERVQPS
jgi:excisionase family DNA binding protein